MVYEVYLHGYTRINKWFMKFVYMDIHEYTNGLQVCLHGYTRVYEVFSWIYTNKQMDYNVCLHGYTRINKWFMRFVYMDIHE